MTEEHLERAVAAAIKFGLETPEAIASFAAEWLAPMVCVEMRDPTAEDLRAGLMAVRLTIARAAAAVH